MQRTLNSFDSKERANNIIIAGLTEKDIEMGDLHLKRDTDKVKYLLKQINVDENIINDPSKLLRIGPGNDGDKRRFLKVTLNDNGTCENIMRNAPKLKPLGAPIKEASG